MLFRRKPVLLAVSSALGALAAVGCAYAQSADPTLGEVVVRAKADERERADGPVQGYRATRSATATRTDTPLKEVPQSITVVSEPLIEDLSMRSIGDVLRYVPGTTAAQGEGNRDQVVLRGNNTTGDFFVDGVRDDAQIFRDLYNAERVEVLKGPAGMIFGRGGAGGVINRVIKKPVFGRTADVELSVGTDRQYRAAVDLGNQATDSAAWRLNAMAESADSYRNGVNLERYAVNPTVTFTPGARTAVTVSLEHARDERTADRGIPSQAGKPFVTDSATFFGDAANSKSESTVNAFAAVIDHDFGGGTSLRNHFRFTDYEKFYQNIFANGAVNTTTGQVAIAAYNSVNDRTNVFNQTDLTTRFKTGGIEHTVLAGLEFGTQDSTNLRNNGFFNNNPATTSVNVSASNPFATPSGYLNRTQDANNKVKVDVAAAYVQDQLALSDSVKLLAGLRHDRFKVDFDDQRAGVTDRSRTDSGTSPRLGLIWSPINAATLYASYSEAMVPASGDQPSLTAGTAELEPETAKNYELGGRFDLTPVLTLSAAVFQLDRENVRVGDPARPGFFITTGETRTEGYELGLQGKVLPSWEIFAGYAKLDAEITRATADGPAGRQLPAVPEEAVSLWNKVALGGGWSVGLGVIHQSASFTSIGNTVQLPSYTRTDGAIYYAFGDGKTRLALNVENLSDETYYPNAHNDNNITPGAPRNARLTLNTTF
ncbi:MAG TPA: TonB-dependent siderophore receptor [Rhodocyclaceae bacterium]|nr:TonB-dependent siderophore receptor [Rhodocyclaceae bacterium]